MHSCVVPNTLLAPYGFPGRIDEIKRICEKHGALLIEDAAEAMGATVDGRQCGSFGDYIKEQAISKERANEFESEIRTYYCDCIAKKFYHEADLLEFTKKDLCLCDFLHSCLDCIEWLMSSK